VIAFSVGIAVAIRAMVNAVMASEPNAEVTP
jgi:hypothetical protein